MEQAVAVQEPKRTIFLVEPRMVGRVWDLVEHFIISAMQRGHDTHTVEEIQRDVARGRLRVWIVHEDGLAVACALTMQDGAVLRVTHLGGTEAENWLEELINTWVEWGFGQDCDRIEMTGRLGWIRKLKPYGFSEDYVKMSKPIGGGDE